MLTFRNLNSFNVCLYLILRTQHNNLISKNTKKTALTADFKLFENENICCPKYFLKGV